MSEARHIKTTEYQIERDFSAPIERVFAAWTQPDLLAKWVWGADAKNCVAEIDLRVGGRIFVECDAMGPTNTRFGARHGFSGLITTCDGPRHFGFTQHWWAPVFYNNDEHEPLDEVIDVRLTPTVGGTHLVYRHIGMPDDFFSAKHHKMSVAWTFNDLAKLLAE